MTRGMVNPVVFWVFRVGSNAVLHINILVLRVGLLKKSAIVVGKRYVTDYI